MATILPNPVRVHSSIKLARWSLLALGVLYGSTRHSILKKREDARRAKEEEERPAKEAAMKAEKERANQAELAYLNSIGISVGGGGGGGSGPSGPGGAGGGQCLESGRTPDGKYKSECGCTY